MQTNDLSTWFYQGKYSKVLEIVGTSPISPIDVQFEIKSSFQLASLIFLGGFREAVVLFERALKVSTPSLLFICQCRFFLGIGCVRRSDYAGAVRYFSQNLLAVKKIRGERTVGFHELTFYAHQGSAFYRFFRGQFEKAYNITKKSYASAYEGNFSYGQILSLDLMGHSLCQVGSVSRGIHELKTALTIARKLGNGGIATAIDISIVMYRAQFGINIQKSILNLERAVESLHPEDTYSKAELYLELIRQLVLRGKGSEAKIFLEKAGKLIYQHQNKRQYAIFNQRCAYLQFLNGERQAALALTVSLKNNLDPKVDLVIIKQVEGLIDRINSHRNDEPFSKDKSTHRSTTKIDSRIRSRLLDGDKTAVNSGEDPIGDILDMISNGEKSALYVVKKHGLWGLVPKALKIPVGASILFLGPSRSEIIIFRGADIVWVDRGVTMPIKKLIINLRGAQFKSKEFLVRQVWGYQYDPSIHDRLLHATIGKLRGVLGSYGNWIEWSNAGYKLAESISVIIEGQEKTLPNEEIEVNYTVRQNLPLPKGLDELELNIRQFKLTNSLKPGDFVSVREYAKRHKICNMTACRDLTSLHLAGRLVRMGRGRATIYRLP